MVNSYPNLLSEEYKVKYEIDKVNLFLAGFIIYTIGFILHITYVPYPFINLTEILQFLGACLVSISSLGLIRFKNITDRYLAFFITLLFAWVYFLIAWSLKLDFGYFKELILSGPTFFSYFIPLIVFFPLKISFLKKIFKSIAILGVLFLILTLAYWNAVTKVYDINSVENEKYIFEGLAKYLSAPAGFIIMSFSYHSKKVKVLAFVVIVTALLIAIFRARRALIFISAFPLLVAYFTYIFRSKYKGFAILSTIVLVLVTIQYGYGIYFSNKNGFFEQISERATEDTRTKVENCLYNDFSIKDWIVGRGFDGKYFCPNIDLDYEVPGYRSMIETDYLNIILKSGTIYLLLLLLILIPASINGIFYSKNLLSKVAGFWILFWVLNLYPANVFAFSMHYLLVWISVGICYSKKIRNIPENILIEAFNQE